MNTTATISPGQNILAALKAVARFHSDTSKLLVDCDKHIGKGRRSIFGSYATQDLTYHVKADFWMPEGMFRYYEAGPALVDAVAVTFFNADGTTNPELETEPIFKLAKIQYRCPEDVPREATQNIEARRTSCKAWDVWSLFFRETKERTFQRVFEYSDVDHGRIVWARLIAVPLLSINKIEGALELMDLLEPDSQIPRTASLIR